MAAVNTPVRAIRSGRVVKVERHRGMGRYIELDHGRGLHSLYAHLNSVDMQKGQHVTQGQIIGLVGKTGNARHSWITPHLHLEVVRKGTPVNPATLGVSAMEPATRMAQTTAPGALMDETGGE